jgi:hypothetical protein
MLTGNIVENLQEFVRYAHSLEGDEKGEAQVFCSPACKQRDYDRRKRQEIG